MQHTEAVAFLQKALGCPAAAVHWLDLGCGNGTFTYALAAHLAAGSLITAMDQAPQHLRRVFHQVSIRFMQADFTQAFSLQTPVDGILMANSLHYVKEPEALIRKLSSFFKKHTARFLIIEYDLDNANEWVPFPVSFARLQQLFHEAGYASVQKMAGRPSVYGHGSLYAAIIK